MRNLRTALSAAALIGAGAFATASPAAAFVNIVDPANPTFTQALGINDSGTIVGYGNATNFDGFVLTLPPVPGNFIRENFPNLSPPPTTLFTQVVGIDATGDTVGFYVSNPAVGTTNGFFKPHGGTFTTLNQPGSVFNQLLGINQAGNEIAGYSSFTDPAGATGQQAFSLKPGAYTNINSLLPVNLNSQATGVNNHGTVVGFYQYDAAGDFSAFADKGGVITSFQVLHSLSTQALGINTLGEIVGDYVDANGVMHGFVDINGHATSINGPDASATTVNGINDRGQIVGFYTSASSGNTIGFVTSVPEPATLALLGSGLIGLAVMRRRRHAAA